ncbi:hypothetical protein D9M71_740020 [compost metagenome]
MLAGDLLASDLVHPLVADRFHAALVEPVEIDPLTADGGTQGHRNMDQTETDGTFPDGSGHDLLPQAIERLFVCVTAAHAEGLPEPTIRAADRAKKLNSGAAGLS